MSITGNALGPHCVCPHPNSEKNKAQPTRHNLIHCALIFSVLIIRLNAEWPIMHYELCIVNCFYILSGISMPSNPIPEVITLATLAESKRRKFLTSVFSSFNIGDA